MAEAAAAADNEDNDDVVIGGAGLAIATTLLARNWWSTMIAPNDKPASLSTPCMTRSVDLSKSATARSVSKV